MTQHREDIGRGSGDAADTAGMRAMFWIWMVIVGGGLAVMIFTALGGR